MSVRGRIGRLERACQHMSEVCTCQPFHVVYGSDDGGTPEAESLVCARCGLPRLNIRVVYGGKAAETADQER